MTNLTDLVDTSLAQELVWIAVSELRIDHRYQRALDIQRVRRMAREFDYDAFGVLIVSKREDESLWAIDGQHRIALMHEIGWGDQQVPCLVHTGLSVEMEAKVFRKANSGSRPNSLAIFRAELTEGGAEAVDIARVVQRCGLSVAPGGKQGCIQAASALRTVYRKTGGLILERVLRHILAAWGNDSTNFQADMLQALALVERRYGKQLDGERLRQQLGTMTVNHLLAAARATKLTGSGSLWANALPEQIVTLYNKAARSKKLPDWERRTNVREVWT